MRMYVCACMCVHVCVCMCVCAFMCVYVHMCVCVCACMCVHVCMCIYVCVHVCVCMCVYYNPYSKAYNSFCVLGLCVHDVPCTVQMCCMNNGPTHFCVGRYVHLKNKLS